MSYPRVCLSRKSDNWATPKDLLKKLADEFGPFDYDPCPLGDNLAFFEIWRGKVFCNPPYSDIKRFLQKGILKLSAGRCQLIVWLLPSRTDTKWYHELLVPHATDIRFVKGRLKFGNSPHAAPFPSLIAIMEAKDNDIEKTRV